MAAGQATRRVGSPVPVAKSAGSDDKNAPAAATVQGKATARVTLCYLLMASRMFQQAMRNSLAPLMVYVADEFNLSTAEKGSLLAAVAAGYFFTQVLGGRLSDKIGAKNVITLAMGLSACCCLLTPAAVYCFGITGLWLTTATMGAVQGPIFPVSFVVLSKWLPKETPGGTDEKAWGTSMLDIGISVGALAIIPSVTFLTGALGWRHAYHIIGLCSLGFVAVWHCFAADEPSKCRYISQEELNFLKKHVETSKPADPQAKGANGEGLLGIPIRLLFHPGLWAIYFAHIAFNYSAYFFPLWGPTYYADVLRLSPDEAQIHLMTHNMANLASKACIPVLLKIVRGRGLSSLSSRRFFTMGGFLVAATAILACYRLRDYSPWATTLLFSLAQLGCGMAPAGFKSNYLEVTNQYVAVTSAYGNTLATGASWAGPKFVALLLQLFSNNWDLVFLSIAVVSVLAGINFTRHSTVEPIERSEESSSAKKTN